MEKLDLAKAYKPYYTAPTKPELVVFEPISYVTIVGKGDPNGAAFANATEALYTVAYGVKGHYKKLEKDFTVAKLEGQWWVDGDPRTALEVSREEWHWKLLIRMPTYVSAEIVEEARSAAMAKKKSLRLLRMLGMKLCMRDSVSRCCMWDRMRQNRKHWHRWSISYRKSSSVTVDFITKFTYQTRGRLILPK